MTSSDQKLPSVERAIRDAKIAPFVNVAGLIVAGAFVVIAGMADEDTALVLNVMGGLIAAVTTLWALFMSVRGFVKADRLGQMLLTFWLIWGECSLGSAVLLFADMRGWRHTLTDNPMELLTALGFPTVLFFGWLIMTIAWPCAWWWMRRAERKRAGQTGRWRRLVRFSWRVVALAALPCALFLPIALMAHIALVGVPGKDWVPYIPAYAQRMGLRFYDCFEQRKLLPASFYANDAVREEVLLELLLLGWDERLLIETLSYTESSALVTWLRSELDRPIPRSGAVPRAIREVVSGFPVNEVRPVVERILERPELQLYMNDLLIGLRQSSSEKLQSLKPEVMKLQQMSSVDAATIVGLLSDATDPKERGPYWEPHVLSKGEAQRKIAAEAIRYARFTKGAVPSFEQLLRDAQVSVRLTAMTSLGWNMMGSNNGMPGDLLMRVFDLTQDSDLGVRRTATRFLCNKMDLKIAVPGPQDAGFLSSAETPAELANRKVVVETARKRGWWMWSGMDRDPLKDKHIFRTVLRKQGDDKVHTYRIPGLATTPKGTLIAVFDLRHESAKDLPADIDVGAMRSTDGGQTWSPVQKVLDFDKDEPGSQGNGVGDPTILVDRKTGRIFVAALWSKGNRAFHGSGPGLTPEETGQFVLARSDDDGVTWSKPINITAQVKDPKWRIFFQGPGNGIQLRDGTLIFPAQFRGADGPPHSNFIYNTDGGETWKTAPAAIPGKPPTSEAQIAEREDGSLLLSMRDESHSGKRAWAVYSWKDDIEKGSWGEPWSAVADPTCMASLISHPKGLLLFCNPASTKQRVALTIRASKDGGKTWSDGRLVDPRPCAYSCMTVLPDGQIGVLYEVGEKDPYETLTFASFPLWFLGLKD